MSKTQAELVQVVLQNLGVLDAGQSVAAEDSDLVVLRLQPKVEELNNRHIAYIQDTDDIDDAVFLAFADIMAMACSTAFGVSTNKRQELQALAIMGEQTLKDTVRLRGTRRPLQVYFPGGNSHRYGYRR